MVDQMYADGRRHLGLNAPWLSQEPQQILPVLHISVQILGYITEVHYNRGGLNREGLHSIATTRVTGELKCVQHPLSDEGLITRGDIVCRPIFSVISGGSYDDLWILQGSVVSKCCLLAIAWSTQHALRYDRDKPWQEVTIV